MKLTYEVLHELLDADFKSGILTWKLRNRKWFARERDCKRWNTCFAGKIAGSNFTGERGKTYRQIRIFNRNYKLHRVLWLMKTGIWPDEVDHIDGCGCNNRNDNLRSVNRKENCKNTRLRADNVSGVTGVYWCKKSSKWVARIKLDDRFPSLGHFENFEDAVRARKEAERKHGFHPNHGQDRAL